MSEGGSSFEGYPLEEDRGQEILNYQASLLMRTLVKERWTELDKDEIEFLKQEKEDVEHIGEFINSRVKKIREGLFKRGEFEADNPYEIAMMLLGLLVECGDWDDDKKQAVRQFAKGFLAQTIQWNYLNPNDQAIVSEAIHDPRIDNPNQLIEESILYWTQEISDPTMFIKEKIKQYGREHDLTSIDYGDFVVFMDNAYKKNRGLWSKQKNESFIRIFGVFKQRIFEKGGYIKVSNYEKMLKGLSEKEKDLVDKMLEIIV